MPMSWSSAAKCRRWSSASSSRSARPERFASCATRWPWPTWKPRCASSACTSMSVTCEKKLRCASRRSALWSATDASSASVESASSSRRGAPRGRGVAPRSRGARRRELAGSGTASRSERRRCRRPRASSGRPDSSTEPRRSRRARPRCARVELAPRRSLLVAASAGAASRVARQRTHSRRRRVRQLERAARRPMRGRLGRGAAASPSSPETRSSDARRWLSRSMCATTLRGQAAQREERAEREHADRHAAPAIQADLDRRGPSRLGSTKRSSVTRERRSAARPRRGRRSSRRRDRADPRAAGSSQHDPSCAAGRRRGPLGRAPGPADRHGFVSARRRIALERRTPRSPRGVPVGQRPNRRRRRAGRGAIRRPRARAARGRGDAPPDRAAAASGAGSARVRTTRAELLLPDPARAAAPRARRPHRRPRSSGAASTCSPTLDDGARLVAAPRHDRASCSRRARRARACSRPARARALAPEEQRALPARRPHASASRVRGRRRRGLPARRAQVRQGAAGSRDGERHPRLERLGVDALARRPARCSSTATRGAPGVAIKSAAARPVAARGRRQHLRGRGAVPARACARAPRRRA